MSDEPDPEAEPEPEVEPEVAPEPPAEPLPDQADPTDSGVFGAEPDPEPESEDPNTYPDEKSPIGGGPLYRRTGP